MVSRGVVAVVLAVLAQAALSSSSYLNNCQCQCTKPIVTMEESCCPGPVVEQKYVVPKTAVESYVYQEPVYSKQCYQRPSGVAKGVVPSAFETAPVCETQETIVKVPTTDVEVNEQPLCRTTCTTSEYVIQIPIVETTCTSSPLCKKTVRTQDNVLTTVSQKTNCAKNICTQNTITETPITETVCQNYQGAVNKVGTKTVVVPEVHKKCVQLPPTKCLKPKITNSVVTTGVDNLYVDGVYDGYYGYGGYDAGVVGVAGPAGIVGVGPAGVVGYDGVYAGPAGVVGYGPAGVVGYDGVYAGPAGVVGYDGVYAGNYGYGGVVEAFGDIIPDGVYGGSYFGPYGGPYGTYGAIGGVEAVGIGGPAVIDVPYPAGVYPGSYPYPAGGYCGCL